MRNDVLDAVAWLASVDAQRRYIAHGSTQRYVLPEELLNDAFAVLEHTLRMPAQTAEISPAERGHLSDFMAILDAVAPHVPVDGSRSAATVIESDPSWLTIRAAAINLLSNLGFDIEAWTRREIEGHQH
jgi:hypothetical protein